MSLFSWLELIASGLITGGIYALVALGLAGSARLGRLANVAGGLFVAGSVCFSGSLYLLTMTGISKLGIITPFGGLAFLAGWLCLGVHAWRLTPTVS